MLMATSQRGLKRRQSCSEEEPAEQEAFDSNLSKTAVLPDSKCQRPEQPWEGLEGFPVKCLT